MPGGVGCHHPGCPDPADVPAYDEMFKINIAFCEQHAEQWTEKEHIAGEA